VQNLSDSTSVCQPARLAIFNPDLATDSSDTRLTPEPVPSQKARKAKRKGKSAKPDTDFPLWLHPSGRWCRKIRRDGVTRWHYFGTDKQAALEKWLDEKDDLLAGRTPRVKSDGLLIGDPPSDPESATGLVNLFLTAKQKLVETGEISQRTFLDYKMTGQRLVDVFGWHKRVDDIAIDDLERLRTDIAKTRGLVALSNEIGRCRVIFKFAEDRRLIASPVPYRQNLAKPSKKSLRKERAAKGPRMFEAAEIRAMLSKASPTVKAFILLGINCGLGQSDLANMPRTAVNLETGWLYYPRPKTGVERRCWLWPQTVEALKVALEIRHEPKDPADSGLAFITNRGARWSRINQKGTIICSISGEFKKLLAALNINGHRSFYALRHSFETIGGGCRDQVAVNFCMGHVDNSMAAAYREKIDDDRLQAVAEHVRRWLFPQTPQQQ
jgi:integrase